MSLQQGVFEFLVNRDGPLERSAFRVPNHADFTGGAIINDLGDGLPVTLWPSALPIFQIVRLGEALHGGAGPSPAQRRRVVRICAAARAASGRQGPASSLPRPVWLMGRTARTRQPVPMPPRSKAQQPNASPTLSRAPAAPEHPRSHALSCAAARGRIRATRRHWIPSPPATAGPRAPNERLRRSPKRHAIGMGARHDPHPLGLCAEGRVAEKTSNELGSVIVLDVQPDQAVTRMHATALAEPVIQAEKGRLWKVVKHRNQVFVVSSRCGNVHADKTKVNPPITQQELLACGQVFVEHQHGIP